MFYLFDNIGDTIESFVIIQIMAIVACLNLFKILQLVSARFYYSFSRVLAVLVFIIGFSMLQIKAKGI